MDKAERHALLDDVTGNLAERKKLKAPFVLIQKLRAHFADYDALEKERYDTVRSLMLGHQELSAKLAAETERCVAAVETVMDQYANDLHVSSYRLVVDAFRVARAAMREGR